MDSFQGAVPEASGLLEAPVREEALEEPAFAASSASGRSAEPSLPEEASGVSASVLELGEAFLREVPSSEASQDFPSEADHQEILSDLSISSVEKDPSVRLVRHPLPSVYP